MRHRNVSKLDELTPTKLMQEVEEQAERDECFMNKYAKSSNTISKYTYPLSILAALVTSWCLCWLIGYASGTDTFMRSYMEVRLNPSVPIQLHILRPGSDVLVLTLPDNKLAHIYHYPIPNSKYGTINDTPIEQFITEGK